MQITMNSNDIARILNVNAPFLSAKEVKQITFEHHL